MLKLTVASPCTESWAAMRGDDRARHCAKCRLTVHNVANLSEAEVRALFSTGGRVCARLYQRADGTVLTQDCPVGLARVRRKLAAGLTAAAALFLAAFSLRGPAACPSTLPNGGSVTDRLRSDLSHAEDWLRGTKTFGPLVEWLDPAVSMKMGDVAIAVPPAHPAP